jgi:hypothetical protein
MNLSIPTKRLQFTSIFEVLSWERNFSQCSISMALWSHESAYERYMKPHLKYNISICPMAA